MKKFNKVAGSRFSNFDKSMAYDMMVNDSYLNRITEKNVREFLK